MKKNAIIRIVLYSLSILLLLAMLITGIQIHAGNRLRFQNGNKTAAEIPEGGVAINTTGHEARFLGSDIRSLKIQWAAGSIRIAPHDSAELIVKESEVDDYQYTMKTGIRNGTLSIVFTEEHGLRFGSMNHLSKDLTIFVPRDWICNSLEIEAGSAEVMVREMTIRDVEFDGASGMCEFRDCVIDSLDLNTASGDVDFSGMLNTLDCDSASADISAVITNIPEQVDVDTMSGNLNLTLPSDCGFTVILDGLSTELTSDFPTTVKNGNHVCGNGRCRIELDAISGCITIRRADTESLPFGQ